MTFVKFFGMAIALAFGLILSLFFWWEVAEPIRSTGWKGSAEQWLALTSVVMGGCATLMATGAALFALCKAFPRDV